MRRALVGSWGENALINVCVGPAGLRARTSEPSPTRIGSLTLSEGISVDGVRDNSLESVSHIHRGWPDP